MKQLFFVSMLFWGWQTASTAGAVTASVTNQENQPISDAVITVTPANLATSTKKNKKTIVIDQVDKEFIDHVTVIPVGSSVLFPNKDNIRHHVYSFSATKAFELPLYIGIPADPIIFDKPGVVKLGCNIHDWMQAYIYVSSAPYFGTTDKNGKLRLDNLTTGDYSVHIWHPRMKIPEQNTQQPITIDHKEGKTLSWQLELKPQLRARRAPIPIQLGY